MNYELLEKLCLTSGPSGSEDDVRDVILGEINSHVKSLKTDKMGNVLAFKTGKSRSNKKLLLCAHMDEVGFVVTYINEEGFLSFKNVGAISSCATYGKKILIGDKKTPGIVCANPIHLLDLCDKKNEKLAPKNMYIDIGASTRKEAQKFVSLGDMAVFASDFTRNRGFVTTKALDDRFGCAALIELIKKELAFDTYFLFTVQEEVGMHGSKCAAYQIKPDVAIVVESTTASDILNVDFQYQVCTLGEGPVLSFLDKKTIYDKKYVNFALKIAKENKTKLQIKRSISGGNDAGEIHRCGSGVKTLAISLPVRYLHTAYSVACEKDMSDTLSILKLLIKKIPEYDVF
ncbi:MAG: M42 family peptidase [Oscillospiraceae bacterium]|nr:M42 family peptidase [Oscillospiraceae bacterium]